MSGWPTVPLDQICEISIGKTPPRKLPRYWDRQRESGNVWLSIADLPLTTKPTVSDSKEYISDEGAALCKIVPAGTLLVSFKLSLGRLAFAGRDLFTNEAIAALRLRNPASVCQEYLYWYLTHFDWKKAAENDHKIKGLTLNKAKVKAIPMLLPPLAEQKRIVAILDAAFEGIDTAIANAEQNLANACALFASYRELCLEDGQTGWLREPLSELASIKHGFAFKSEFFADHPTSEVVLTPGNFHEAGGYRDRGDKQKFYEGPIPFGFVLKPGQLLMAMTEQAAGLLGSSMIVPEDATYLHNQRLGLFEPHTDVAWSPRFFSHVFNLSAFRAAVHESASGVKVRHTSPGKISAIAVGYPPDINAQERIAADLDDFAEGTHRLGLLAAEKVRLLTDLKAAIVSKAFAGQLSAETSATEIPEAAE